MPTPERPRHYHLVSAQVVFYRQGSEVIEQVGMNTPIITDKGVICAKEIGRAQQAVQMALQARFPTTPLDVRDVFISAISDLGKQTRSEFMAGMENTVPADELEGANG